MKRCAYENAPSRNAIVATDASRPWKGRGCRFWAASAFAAAFLAAGVVPTIANAQSTPNAFSGFEEDLPPGVDAPGERLATPERESLRPFQAEPEGFLIGDQTQIDTPINEFAGQTRNYDPGLIGGVLGRAKDRLLGRE